ncbi:helix-turn-helix domain-containing protein [Streptomyces aquilus]|uniref:helix-turn-helix domain-containing protein n=1 Tax=Streptomyces aquilus TaxID=2548456 RepID=UPI0037CDF361
MDEHTTRLGQAIQAAREAKRPRLTQPQAAAQLGVSRTTVQNIERGQFSKVTPTVREYARLVGMPDGAVDAIMAGRPVRALHVVDEPDEQQEESAQLGELGLSPAVEYELRQGQTLENMVIPLGPNESDGHLIVALQGGKDLSPEQIARIAARFSKVRPRLQSLAKADEVAD